MDEVNIVQKEKLMEDLDKDVLLIHKFVVAIQLQLGHYQYHLHHHYYYDSS